jgi:ribosomal protein L13
LGEKQFTKLNVYEGGNHSQGSQKPVKWEIKKNKSGK